MKIDKNELAKKIREAENLSNEEKSNLLQLLNEKKTYGLVWENSSEDAWDVMKDSIPVLKEEPSKQIYHGNDNPNHILIEGDNLNALTALCYTHKGLIDVIYIDPPYNTGASNWKYNNDFVNSEDAFRHSKWICWIKRRLTIAKALLKETGIIIATIDDYEVAQLRLLMDEIFGLENYLATVVIKNNPSGRATVRGFSINHEYALFYSKSERSVLGRLSHNKEQRSRYSEKDDVGYYEWENFRKNGTDSDKNDRPKQFFPIIIDTKTNELRIPDLKWNDLKREYDYSLELTDCEEALWPIAAEGNKKVWKYGLERTREVLNDLLVKKKQGKYEVFRKKYLNDEGSLPRTWWDKAEYSARDNGTRVLTNIFGPVKVFDFPKAPEAVKDSLKAANLKNDGIVLDFFAGSGTTLHATMQLNAEDGGHRQCILVTNNENGICENVTYERNKRVIEGYTTRGEAVAGLKNNNLRYYKVDFTPREKTEQNMLRLAIKSIPLLCIKNDIYQEVSQLGNVKNPRKGYRYFKEGDKQMLVILDTDMIGDIVDELGRMNVEESIPTYVYSSGHYPFTGDFDSVSEKVDLYPIPYSIYGACEKHMPLADDKELDQPEDVVLTEEEENLSINDYKTNEE